MSKVLGKVMGSWSQQERQRVPPSVLPAPPLRLSGFSGRSPRRRLYRERAPVETRNSESRPPRDGRMRLLPPSIQAAEKYECRDLGTGCRLPDSTSSATQPFEVK